MVILNESKLNNTTKLSILILLCGSGIFLLSFISSGSFFGGGYIETFSAAAILGAGVVLLSTSLNLKKRYSKYFEENKVITISELSSELNISEKQITNDLSTLVQNKSDIKKFSTCDSIKFGN